MGPNTSKPHLAEQMVCVGKITRNRIYVPEAMILHVTVDVVLEEELVSAGRDMLALQDLLNPRDLNGGRVHVNLEDAEVFDFA